ncbi:hypothetical protein LINPERPRIM_LOCUS14308 [Linum perenne]
MEMSCCSKVVMVMMLMTMVIVSNEVRVVEGVVGVQMDPCIVSACTTACQKILGPKFKSAVCTVLPPATKPICLCT